MSAAVDVHEVRVLFRSWTDQCSARGALPRSTSPRGREAAMMTLFRSRVVGRSVLGALVLSFTVGGIAAAQTECKQDVVGVTNYGNRLDGELVGSRSETTTITETYPTASGSLTGSASTGVVSGSATISGTSGTTTITTTTIVNIGTYTFEDGSRYDVNCSTNMTIEKLYPVTGEEEVG